MSQFAMIQFQGAPNLKLSSSETVSGLADGEAAEGMRNLTFSQALQELSETDPNGTALLLALQQSGMLPGGAAELSLGGSALPPAASSGGKSLPLPMLQSLQSVGADPAGSALSPMPEIRQLLSQTASGNTPLAELIQSIPATLRGELSPEALKGLESRGLGDFSTQLHGLTAGLHQGLTTAASGVRPVIALPVQVPVGQAEWGNALGDRIQWMVSRNVQQAEIKLTPPDLGPLEIRISVQNDQTHVNFIAGHSATREALEAAIPRLRELFGEINLNLANVDVNQRQADGTAYQQQGSSGGTAGSGEAFTEPGHESFEETGPHRISLLSRGLLDTYA